MSASGLLGDREAKEAPIQMTSNKHIFIVLLFSTPSPLALEWGQDQNKGYTQYMSGLVNLTVLRMTQWKVA